MESLSFTNMTFQITAIILKPNCPKSKGPESFLLQSTRSPSVPWTPLQLDTEVFRPFSLTRECTTAISVFPHQGLLARQQNCVMLASEENNREKCFVGKLQQGKWIINMLHERTVAGSCVWVWGAHETQGETAMHPKDAGPPASASAAAAPSRGRRRLKLPQARLGCYRSSYLMAKTPQDLSALLKSG